MREVQIAPQNDSGKGRTFRATLLAYVESDRSWDGGVSDNTRPVLAMFAGSEQELRPFIANLTMGKKAAFLRTSNMYRRPGKDEWLEIMKSAGYKVTWQREEEGSIATVYLPDLFQLDPGLVDSQGIKFVLLPTQEWYASQVIDARPIVLHAERCGYKQTPEEIADIAPLAYLFAAYLDRRTRCPLISDGRFYMQLMLSCLKNELATYSLPPPGSGSDYGFGQSRWSAFWETDTMSVGFRPGISFLADHVTFEKLLADEVSAYFAITNGT